jgi:hypothetical protein
MINQLKITNVGPAPEMELDFGKRLNLLTGDNGLGKSFLVHPGIAYLQVIYCQSLLGSNTIEGALNRSPTLARAGLGAGRVIGPFLQLFETLPQPLPELREGGYSVHVLVLFGCARRCASPMPTGSWVQDEKYPFAG